MVEVTAQVQCADSDEGAGNAIRAPRQRSTNWRDIGAAIRSTVNIGVRIRAYQLLLQPEVPDVWLLLVSAVASVSLLGAGSTAPLQILHVLTAERHAGTNRFRDPFDQTALGRIHDGTSSCSAVI